MFLTREHQNTWGKKIRNRCFHYLVWGFNTSIIRKDWNSRQKTSMDIVELNNSNNHLDISYVYRLSHNSICTLLKHTWNTKTTKHFNKFKIVEIIRCLFWDQNGVKLEVSDRDNENFQICDLLHNTGFKKKISGKPKNILKENTTYKNS